MAEYGFRFDNDTLTPALEAFDDATDRFLTATMGYHAPRAEAAMKKNAPWTDRTTNARDGLGATADFEDRPDAYRIVLFHSVPYGIYLEAKHGGRYATILPTSKSEGREVMKTIKAGLFPSIAGGI